MNETRTIETEIVLSTKANPQPSPSIVKGGDCGFCCLSGIFNVSCSARHPEGRWIRVVEFLRQNGGYNVVWIKPKS